jgi:hypothetical protein
MFVDLPSGWTAKIVSVRYKIRGGTSATFKMQDDGADITGFTSLSCTTTAAETAPTAVTIADASYLAPVITAVVGSPDNISISAVIEYTKS